MKPISTLFLSAALVVLQAPSLHCRILRVPDDHGTIQAAVNASENGDTVLIAPGRYRESVRITDRTLVIASHYILELDERLIEGTIVDGNRNDWSIFWLRHAEGEFIPQIVGLHLTGAGINGLLARNIANLRIRNCLIDENGVSNPTSGGGIFLDNCTEALVYRTSVLSNTAEQGGGLHIGNRSTAVITHSNIRDNVALTAAGGVYCVNSRLEMIYTVVADNSAEQAFGGVWLLYASTADFRNVTFSGNLCGGGRSGALSLSTLQNNFPRNEANLVNCILFGNSPPQVRITTPAGWSNGLAVSYSDIQGGENGIVQEGQGEVDFDYGEGNINLNPCFVNSENGDYHLRRDSPCIDTGHPDMRDHDGSRADMGGLPFLQLCFVEGFVLSDATGVPLPEAVVSAVSAEGMTAEAQCDEEGFWRIQGSPLLLDDFSLTAACPRYASETAEGLHVDEGDTLRITFRLPQPMPRLEPDRFRVVLEEGLTDERRLTLTNIGRGGLIWSGRPNALGEAGAVPWTVREQIPLGAMLDEDRIEAVAFIDGLYYVAASMGGDPQIYVVNRDREVIDRFPQPVRDDRRIRDLAWDGELLWGGIGRTVYGFTLRGEVRVSFEAPIPIYPITSLTYDQQNQLLWLSGTTTDIYAVRRNGEGVQERLSRRDLRIYGLAYWPDDPDGYPLYVFHRDRVTNAAIFHKINPENDDTLFAGFVDRSAAPGGAFLTDEFDPVRVPVLMTVLSRSMVEGGDEVRVLQLSPRPIWLDIAPTEGVVESGADENIIVFFDGVPEVGEYEVELQFQFNGVPPEARVPVRFIVERRAIVDLERTVPADFDLEGIFPNPFNMAAEVRFDLPVAASVTLSLHDVRGRRLRSMAAGRFPSGSHSVLLDGAKLSAGVYLLRLEAEGRSATKKAVLVK